MVWWRRHAEAVSVIAVFVGLCVFVAFFFWLFTSGAPMVFEGCPYRKLHPEAEVAF